MSPPSPETGVAAPMLVPGAIAAMLAATVMNTPADPARDPDGYTNTITGMGLFSRVVVMSRVACNSPPGVSSSTTNAPAFAFTASACARIR
jgi:uncharacterized membrane protein